MLLSGLDSDSDHHYESITYEESHDDDFDSFESDTESEKSLPKATTLVSGFIKVQKHLIYASVFVFCFRMIAEWTLTIPVFLIPHKIKLTYSQDWPQPLVNT